MTRRALIVTADDVGLTPGMTEGAIRAHRDGIVTACSIVANGAAFDDAVARLRDTPSLAVGVHLTLVEETPLTAMRFPNKYTSFVPLYLARAIPMRAIEAELRAQIEKVLATGLPVTHLNGHQHLHVLPRIFALVRKLAAEHAIGYVRTIDDYSGAGVPPASPGHPARADSAVPTGETPVGCGRDARPTRGLAIAALNFLGRRAPGTNQRTIGVAAAGHLDDVVPLLDHVEGLTELVTHPGVAVTGYDHWGYAWDAETRALCDPRLRDELAKRGIELTSPAHL